MIRMSAIDDQGRMFVLLGITRDDFDELLKGGMVGIAREELGIMVDIHLMVRETDDVIVTDLKTLGFIPEDVDPDSAPFADRPDFGPIPMADPGPEV